MELCKCKERGDGTEEGLCGEEAHHVGFMANL